MKMEDEDFEEYLKFYCHQNKITSKMTEVEQFEIWKKFKRLRKSSNVPATKRKNNLNIKENKTKKQKTSSTESSSEEVEEENSKDDSESSSSDEEYKETPPNIPLKEFCSLLGLKEKKQVKYVRKRLREFKKLNDSPSKVKDFHNLYHLDHASTIGVLNILFKDEKSQKIVAPKLEVDKFMKNFKKK
jgi:hypothetical protein